MVISANNDAAIGVMGGMFNPVHNGHIAAALALADAFSLDSVNMLPCHQPVHKIEPEQSSTQRSEMLALAIKKQPKLNLDEREIVRAGPSFTVDSLAQLRKQLGEKAAVYFMLGTDAFAHIEQWHCWQQLFEYANVVVVHRAGTKLQLNHEFLQQRKKTFVGKHQASGALFELIMPALDISSTQVRTSVQAHRSISAQVPTVVENYIHQHNLYQ